jgi:hypothetical protein
LITPLSPGLSRPVFFIFVVPKPWPYGQACHLNPMARPRVNGEVGGTRGVLEGPSDSHSWRRLWCAQWPAAAILVDDPQKPQRASCKCGRLQGGKCFPTRALGLAGKEHGRGGSKIDLSDQNPAIRPSLTACHAHVAGHCRPPVTAIDHKIMPFRLSRDRLINRSMQEIIIFQGT